MNNPPDKMKALSDMLNQCDSLGTGAILRLNPFVVCFFGIVAIKILRLQNRFSHNYQNF